MGIQKAHIKSHVEVTLQVADRILRNVGGGRARIIRNALKTKDFGCVVNQHMPVPVEYADAYSFARDYLSYNLLRKYPDFELGIDRADVALSAFLTSERTCADINRYNGYFPYTFDSDVIPITQTLEATLSRAREKIKSVLGPFNWNDAARKWRFSGGASTRLRRASGDLYYKLQGTPHVTREAALLGVCAIWYDEGWRKHFQSVHGRESDPQSWVKIVPGSRYTTVPKTAKTDRGICIEPDLNMLLQLGIGAVIRDRLKTVRINLNDQTYNQYLARCGSGTGALATIDLKSASDSISLQLVKNLLPADWFDALSLTRCSEVELPNGVIHRLEKISSMGNGYTFELESLIFWAISAAVLELSDCADTRLGVYGDDIVIHHSVAPRLIEVLASCGFETNKDKTFLSGPFRESCGKHYFYAADVSPFAITHSIDGPNRLFLHWNQCGTWFRPLVHAQDYLLRTLPSGMRDWVVPHFMSDEAGLKKPLDQASPRWCRKRQQWRYRCLQPRRKKHVPNGYVAVLAWLWRSSNVSADRAPYILEKGDVKYVRSFGYTSQWDALG